MISHQAIFFRTRAHRSFFYDINFKVCADYKLLIDMVRSGEKFTKINKTIVKFDTTGVSSKNRFTLYNEKERIRKLYPKIYFYHYLKQHLKPLKVIFTMFHPPNNNSLE
jgi:hypothetical protein